MPEPERRPATAIIVMAKEPLPGRVKTRLCPPCTPDQAAAIATAAIHDTLRAATRAGAAQVVLALDGRPGRWVPSGVEVIAQRGLTFADRLGAAWHDVGGPAVQIGMDTPQVTPALLDQAIDELHRPGTGAVLGPADDGGWWLLGLHRSDHRVFAGIPMSRHDTGTRQLDRLGRLGLATRLVPALRDIDTFDDAERVAAGAPDTATARAVERVALLATPSAGIARG